MAEQCTLVTEATVTSVSLESYSTQEVTASYELTMMGQSHSIKDVRFVCPLSLGVRVEVNVPQD
jgi:hypothetical protein